MNNDNELDTFPIPENADQMSFPGIQPAGETVPKAPQRMRWTKARLNAAINAVSDQLAISSPITEEDHEALKDLKDALTRLQEDYAKRK